MRVDGRAIVGGVGVALCLVAMAVVRASRLHDQRFDENLGMYYTTALVVVGAVMAVGGFATSRANHSVRRAGMALALGALVFIIWVAMHPSDVCVLRCGPL